MDIRGFQISLLVSDWSTAGASRIDRDSRPELIGCYLSVGLTVRRTQDPDWIVCDRRKPRSQLKTSSRVSISFQTPKEPNDNRNQAKYDG